jgi:hypothetical protein
MDLTGIGWGQHKPDSPGFKEWQVTGCCAQGNKTFSSM